MAGKIHLYLGDDHRRLDALFERAVANAQTCRCVRVRPIPRGPAKAHRHGGKSSSSRGTKAARWRAAAGRPEIAPRSRRLDCVARAATDSAGDRGHSRILRDHNPVEEDAGGIYDQCEEIIGAEVDEILRQLQNFPEVKVCHTSVAPFVIDAARRALARAGYELGAVARNRLLRFSDSANVTRKPRCAICGWRPSKEYFLLGYRFGTDSARRRGTAQRLAVQLIYQLCSR